MSLDEICSKQQRLSWGFDEDNFHLLLMKNYITKQGTNVEKERSRDVASPT